MEEDVQPSSCSVHKQADDDDYDDDGDGGDLAILPKKFATKTYLH